MPETPPGSAATTSGTGSVTLRHTTAGLVQTWPPVPVGCACRQEDQDPLGCVPQYAMPGVGAVVPLDSYLAVVEALREAQGA